MEKDKSALIPGRTRAKAPEVILTEDERLKRKRRTERGGGTLKKNLSNRKKQEWT